MDFVALISWMIAGLFGGALGAFAGSLLPIKDLRWIAMIAAGAAGASVGALTVQPEIAGFLDRQFGAEERRESFEGIYEKEIRPELVTNRAIARIFADFPEQEGAFKSFLRKSYEQGGEDRLVADSREAGALLSPAVNFYIPRASDKNLVQFAGIMGEILLALEAEDPQACFDMQFGAAYGRPLPDERFRALAGESVLERQAAVISDLIVGAANEPVAFDASQAALLMDGFRAGRPVLDPETAAVAGGQRVPADAGEAKAACHFTATMFRDIAALPQADGALIMRSIAAR